jgi:hypothetical protein
MEEVLRELTEFELDAVAGGNPFNVNANGAFGTATQNNEAEQVAFVGIDVTAIASTISFANG